MQSIAAVESLETQVVAKIEDRDVTRAELAHAFDWVVDRSNWKNPIDVTVALSDRQQLVVAAAVEFFTGSKVSFKYVDGVMVHVAADGYYIAIGA